MADIVVVGAGVIGMGTAMLLAKDGHEVTVLERDPAPPVGSADESWESWERRGVNQFRMPHMFLSRYRQIVESELPEIAKAIDAAGGLRLNIAKDTPEEIRGPERPGDNDYELLTGRRPVVEMAVASVASNTSGITIRRGVAVSGLVTGSSARPGIPHVTGVRTESGETIPADLVVDMTGRRSPLPRWLEDIGARPPLEHLEDTGVMYYGRHFRGSAVPVWIGSPLQALGTISSLALPTDNGTWSLSIVAHAKDKALYGLRDVGRWERTVGSLPLVAHWLDGEPLEDGIVSVGKLEDRHRTFVIDGLPVATGVVAVADSWACSNPSVGRGASIGMLHGLALRDSVRDAGLDDPIGLSMGFHEATAAEVEPWIRSTLDGDRHRMAQIEAGIRGEVYEPNDPAWELTQACSSAALKDFDCFRAFLSINLVLKTPEEALAAPGLVDKVMDLGSGWRDEPTPAPSREELLGLANS